MPRVVIDPVTRIEGHLRIEAEVSGRNVASAWSSGTMFRGLETILKGRDPRDAWLFTQRICGVCTTVHAICSVRAVEDALGIQIPPNARMIRNIIEGIQYVQDHVIHFYHLHALDWVDIVKALDADPAKTSQLAQSISDWPKSSAAYFKGVKERVQAFVKSGQLGPFANAYWGHPAYKLPPEANLMAVAHYLEALEWQREVIKAHAILGGKNPHLQTYLVGGMSCPVDPNSQAGLNADSIAYLKELFAKAKEFVEKVYLPDVLAVAPFYLDWAKVGEGLGNFLSFGDFPLTDTKSSDDPGDLFLPRGVILNRDLKTVHPVDQKKVAEYVTHSWYSYEDDKKSKHPWEGETRPNYTGPKPPYKYLNVDGKYSWLKAPRYDDKAVEVGPLARMLVAYAAGHPRVKHWIDAVLAKLRVGPEALFSTLGRTAARCIETVVIAEQLIPWTDELAANISKGDLRIHEQKHWEPSTWPKEAEGWGWTEAPRGALGHWVRIKDGKIENYQCIVPTTWNASPRDASGQPGAYEAALVGTPVADPEKPLEILRTIHSFDPCIACAVHMVEPRGRKTFYISGC
ncbi:hydrogenase large subunit [Thermodesulfitimonas autotrophica]|uniref:Hydrogenase large subunit n=1 Tax=Thermodesulfitimonas autotrophica TaxID=1894989 RepID=A0A3N5BLW4_9THEO|nr:nickel-dependent hydrogenase large subunit [Thermodesulfitimonas autotrophica]RPF46735.1 hydrogenase large subunit [Thermodesulfitimonas autotrophica]